MTKSFNQWLGQLRGKPILTLKNVKSMKNNTKRCSLALADQMEFVINDNGKNVSYEFRKWDVSMQVLRNFY